MKTLNTSLAYNVHRSLFDVDFVMAFFYVVIFAVVGIIGCLGNLAIMYVVKKEKSMNLPVRMIIFNNATTDFCVAGIAAPMCIAGAIMGTNLYESSPGVCVIMSMLCLTICICTFVSMFYLTFNRYIFICHNKYYNKIFTKYTTLAMCASCWALSAACDMPNFFGYGGHFYDLKTYQCTWNRQVNPAYTQFIAYGLITTPLVFLACFNTAILMFIFKARRPGVTSSKSRRSAISSAKILLTLFGVFVVCWSPYAVMLIMEQHGPLDLSVHLFVTLLAHSHSVGSPLTYFGYKQVFRDNIRRLFGCTTRVEPHVVSKGMLPGRDNIVQSRATSVQPSTDKSSKILQLSTTSVQQNSHI